MNIQIDEATIKLENGLDHADGVPASALSPNAVPPNAVSPSPVRSGRLVGALFLLAFLFYGAGSLLALTANTADEVASVVDAELRIRIGGLLMLVNSGIVAAIGVLMLSVVDRKRRGVAMAYLATRVLEAVLLSMGVIFVFLTVEAAKTGDLESMIALGAGTDISYQVAMSMLGIGSFVFWGVMASDGLVPRWLALWGAAGYAIFATGAALELMDVPAGITMAIPGGLFEVVLGVFLIRKGFYNSSAQLSA